MASVQGRMSTVGMRENANFLNEGDISTMGIVGEEIMCRESN